MAEASRAATLSAVLEQELEVIAKRRTAVGRPVGSIPSGKPPAEGDDEEARLRRVRTTAGRWNLAGLAFSGGGIRSATFGLGVLQALADLKLLARFDYLSTVSGGGYIGSWLTAWIRRNGSAEAVARQLQSSRIGQAAGRAPADPQPCEAEPEPIAHLRAYSNYLAPRLGVNSADGWVLAATYLRNLLLNQLVLLPFLVAILLLPRVALWFCDWKVIPRGGPVPILMALSMVLTLTAIFHAFFRLYRRSANSPAPGRVRQYVRSATPWGFLAAGIAALWPTVHYRAFQESRMPESLWGVLAVTCLAVAIDFLAQESLARTGWRVLWWRIPARSNRGALAKRVLWLRVLLPLFLWSMLSTWFVCKVSAYLAQFRQWYCEMPWMLGIGLASVGGLLSLAFLLRKGSNWVVSRSATCRPPLIAIWVAFNVAAGFAVGFATGWMLQAGHSWLQTVDLGQARANQTFCAAAMVTVGPPLCLLVFALGGMLQSGLMGAWRREAEREWWASLCGWILMSAAVWLTLSGIALFAVPMLWAAGRTGASLLGASWLLTSVAGILAGGSAQTGTRHAHRGWELVATIGPYVLLIGLMILLSAGIDCYNAPADVAAAAVEQPVSLPAAAAEQPTGAAQPARQPPEETADVRSVHRWLQRPHPQQRYFDGLLPQQSPAEVPALLPHRPDSAQPDDRRPAPAPTPVAQPPRRELSEAERYRRGLWSLLGQVAVCLAVSFAFALRVGVNSFSLQGTYANRLVRCYLGASRRKFADALDRQAGAPADSHGARRRPNPLTGFSPDDDLLLHQSYVPDEGGPYPLVNVALNLAEGEELAWQERKAEAFLFSPLHCGSVGTGYRPTTQFGGPVSLGTAVALSGAAVSPNMGYHTSAAVTALLTMFNVRMGAWFGNPARSSWRDTEPRFALGLLLNELFGRTNRHSRYVYLSDGGHFENLGVYELVRRRCRLIVACDASADGDFAFEDLGGLVRKCQVDLGVPIEIHAAPLQPAESTNFARAHCVAATIHYEQVDSRAQPGVLLYIKASLSGDESADVLSYRAAHGDFPHESTADQFFSESQFESYRALGQHIALRALGEVASALPNARNRTQEIGLLCKAIAKCWGPPAEQ